ncbi:AraC family transcriptional regulator [Pseudomonas piscis]|uniref:AraC family transcriptional regulator n=1 Tax=Pseudomonas piscis TaxID=2614538 RepID=UPI0021D5C060|nr:AraC family transcriptional regulator [Pseudomonas piscis]MCU7645291.1 AraC family transcriptional regulator [Pseudomonas piscis]
MVRLIATQETNRIAANFLRHLRRCLRDFAPSFDLPAALHQVGVDARAVLAGDEHGLSFRQYYQLLEQIPETMAEQGFYLRLGALYDITDIGLLGYACLSAENLRKSWDLTFGSTPLLPHPLNGTRQVCDGRVEVILDSPLHPSNIRGLQEEWMASTWHWICQRLPAVSGSRELRLELDYPAPAYKALYGEIFPGRIEFSRPCTRLSFPETWYELPFPAANPSTSRLCHEQCLLVMAQLDRNKSDLIDEVRRRLLMNPQREFPSLEAMAERFRMTPVTFYRHLARAGVNYRTVVLEVRMGLAREYLEKTRIPLQEVSYTLGYDYPPNFYRAFKKWFGMTAQECRFGLEQVVR